MCGKLPVPLDRRNPQGQRIGIYFELYLHTNSGPAESAILLNPGGPGVAIAANRLLVFALFGQNTDVHDFLLIDDRGRGFSQTIDCPELQHGTASFQDGEIDCAAQLGPADSWYGTGDIAMDTDAVRAALGYEKVPSAESCAPEKQAKIFHRQPSVLSSACRHLTSPESKEDTMKSRPLVTLIALAIVGGSVTGACARQLAAQACNSNSIEGMLNASLPQKVLRAFYAASSSTVNPPTVHLSSTIVDFIAPLPHPPSRPRCTNTSPNPQTVTLTNIGPGVLHITSVTISGPFSQTNNCGASLGAGQSCSIVVTWGKSTSINESSLSIYDDGAGSPHLVYLNGILGCPFF
jgi:hypothetical protein